MATPLDAWKAIAKFHEAQLDIAKSKMQELEAAAAPPVDPLLTHSEMKKRVLAIETRKAYKRSWKKAVDDGLIDNVQGILYDCYKTYLDRSEMGVEFVEAAKKRMGKKDSLQWQLFILEVIQHLWKTGSFLDEDGSFNTYEDTAGGCDEITWDAGIDIIEASYAPSAPVPAPTLAPALVDDAAAAAAERAQYGRA
jgi:hypothetical protein